MQRAKAAMAVLIERNAEAAAARMETGEPEPAVPSGVELPSAVPSGVELPSAAVPSESVEHPSSSAVPSEVEKYFKRWTSLMKHLYKGIRGADRERSGGEDTSTDFAAVRTNASVTVRLIGSK